MANNRVKEDDKITAANGDAAHFPAPSLTAVDPELLLYQPHPATN